MSVLGTATRRKDGSGHYRGVAARALTAALAAVILGAGAGAGSSTVAADPQPGPPSGQPSAGSQLPILPPGPPPPGLPARVAAIALMESQASSLQSQIAQQTLALDQVTAKAVAARAGADAAAARSQAAAHLAVDASTAATRAGNALKSAAFRIYVFGPGAHADDLKQLKNEDPYELARAHAYAESAFNMGGEVLAARQRAKNQRVAALQALKDDERSAKKASDDAAQLQQAALAQQEALRSTLLLMGGQLAATEAADRADVAQQAALHLSRPDALEFVPSRPLPPLMANAANALSWAFEQLGKPYTWGATGPNTFDCSGLMLYSWNLSGVAIPRTSAQQQAWAAPVPLSALLPGDLVFFGTTYIHHVGMYIGSGMMINAPHTGDIVRIAPIWWEDLVGFGRVHGPDVVVPPHPFGSDAGVGAGGGPASVQPASMTPVVKPGVGVVPSEPPHPGDPLDPIPANGYLPPPLPGASTTVTTQVPATSPPATDPPPTDPPTTLPPATAPPTTAPDTTTTAP